MTYTWLQSGVSDIEPTTYIILQSFYNKLYCFALLTYQFYENFVYNYIVRACTLQINIKILGFPSKKTNNEGQNGTKCMLW